MSLMCSHLFFESELSKLSPQAILTDSIKSLTKINKTSVQTLFWNFDIYACCFQNKDAVSSIVIFAKTVLSIRNEVVVYFPSFDSSH